MPPFTLQCNPNPDEPVGAKRKSRFIGELKIEDCKLNICGCRSRSAGACAASLNIQYSIENIQSLQDSENIPIQFFRHKMHKNNN
jgi:hypothetical protein